MEKTPKQEAASSNNHWKHVTTLFFLHQNLKKTPVNDKAVAVPAEKQSSPLVKTLLPTSGKHIAASMSNVKVS